jgi:hypothetical protein
MNAESLSILIPPCNEEESVPELPTREIQAPLPDGLDRKLVIVEDCFPGPLLNSEAVVKFPRRKARIHETLINHVPLSCDGRTYEERQRTFDGFVWLWREIDNALPWEPASVVAIVKRWSS